MGGKDNKKNSEDESDLMKKRKTLKRTGIVLCWLVILFCLSPPDVVPGAAGTESKQTGRVRDAPVIQSVEATSQAAVCLSWKKVKHAARYTVYRAAEKNGEYEKLKITSQCAVIDRTGKPLHTYYYKVAAVYKDDLGQWEEGKCSRAAKVKVRRVARKTAYVGDSIMSGFRSYGIIKNTKKQRVIAKIGISTSNFYKGNLMGTLLHYNPDRMFIMLGMNALPGKRNVSYMDYILKYYGYIIKACLKKKPDMEIIVVGVTPVSRYANVRLANVKLFNKKLKKLISNYQSVHYLDLFPVLADSDGYLARRYNGGDGVHWKKATYDLVLKEMDAFINKFAIK